MKENLLCYWPQLAVQLEVAVQAVCDLKNVKPQCHLKTLTGNYDPLEMKYWNNNTESNVFKVNLIARNSKQYVGWNEKLLNLRQMKYLLGLTNS